ncbi:PREDICTED: SH3 domain-binding glutamic acid-rich-like protein [Pygoscelis adeliae]|nr:PREDICTED: SH3 domain-binding glutamic acid-rich-like protein [Pygoscelis adeliae]
MLRDKPSEFKETVSFHNPDLGRLNVYGPSNKPCFPDGPSWITVPGPSAGGAKREEDLLLNLVTSVGKEIKKQQQDVLGFLEANKIEFEEKDIAANEENRKWMRENVPEDSRPASGNPLPPRLFNDSQYLGDYEAFFEARENNAVYAFLGLTAPPGSKEAEALAKQQA